MAVLTVREAEGGGWVVQDHRGAVRYRYGSKQQAVLTGQALAAGEMAVLRLLDRAGDEVGRADYTTRSSRRTHLGK